MLEKYVRNILELNWNQRLGHKETKLNICHPILTSSTQLQNWSSHVVERTRTSSKCQKKMKNARAKRAKILFFIVKYANLWSFCCRRRRGCLSSLWYNYPPKARWIVVDIYRDAKRRGIYPPLFTDPEGDSCFSKIRWIKKCCFNFFWNFRETTRHFSFRSQNSE